MATNNAINLKDAGIASYDGAGTFTAVATPIIVGSGGTGTTSQTAYAVLCGGTTTTNPVQSIASVGTAGQLLTSNGAGALPTFQTKTKTGSGTIFTVHCTAGDPTNSTTYYLADGKSLTSYTSSNIKTKFYCPIACTFSRVTGTITVQGTLGSSFNASIEVSINAAAPIALAANLSLASANNPFDVTPGAFGVNAGDSLEFVYYAQSSTPTTVSVSVSFLMV